MIPIYSLTYSIPYVIAFLFLGSLAYIEQKSPNRKNIIRRICILFFLIFFGLRGFVAWDWMGYYPTFESIDRLTEFTSDSFVVIMDNGRELDLIEPGYVLYVSFIKTIFNNWHFFIFISSLIDILIIDIFIRRFSPNYAFAILVFCSISFVLEFDLMRNIKALGIFLLAIDSIIHRRWFIFVLLTLIGISFHRSFLVFIPLYFVGMKNFGRSIWIIIFIICNIIYFTHIPIATYVVEKLMLLGGDLSVKAIDYAGSDSMSAARGFTLGYIVRSLVFLCVTANYNKILQLNKELIIILNIYLAYFIINTAFTDFGILATRLDLLFGISLWILYPILSYLYKGTKRKLFIGFISSYLLLTITQRTSNAMYDYENLLTGYANYEERYSTHRSIAYEILDE